MLVKIEDLQIGDEIIISGNSKLKYLKVLKKPELSNKPLWGTVIDPKTKQFTWDKTSNFKWKAVRCSIRQDEIPYKSRSGFDLIHKQYVFEQNVSKHNKKISIDLNGKDVFLVSKEDN